MLSHLVVQFTMGCCGCGPRVTSIFAAIFSLVQACITIGIAVVALQLYSCNISPDVGAEISLTDTAGLVLYLTYFLNKDCIASSITITLDGSVVLPDGSTPTITITNNQPTAEPTERTQGWMIAYVTLSSIWIAASILLLVGALGNKKGVWGAITYFPWVLTTAAIIICDVITSTIYFSDVKSTYGVSEFLTFIGVTPPAAWNPDMSPADLLTTVPSIAMGILFSRFVVIWIINLCLFGYVTAAAITASRRASKPADWKRLSKPHLSESSDPKTWLTPVTTDPQPRTDEPLRQPPYPFHAYPPHQSSSLQPFSYLHQQSPRASTEELFQNGSSELPKSSLQMASDHRYSQQRFKQPQHPSGLNRSESVERRAAPQELRSQLPWSYFKSRDEVPGKMQSANEYEELPPIPVPDYTLHFPKKTRLTENYLQDMEAPIYGGALKLTQPNPSVHMANGRYDRY